MGNFKYNIVTLIELVESKPCIWDKTNEYNKNKIVRDKSWQEIFLFLEDGYEELSHAEKKKTGDNIMAKWSNIRDSFLRSLRTKSGQGAKRRYIYSEHLQFLLKLAQKDDTDSNFSQVGTEDDSIDVEDLTASQPLTTSSRSQPKSTSQALPTALSNRSTSRENQTRSKRQLDDVEREILSELKKGKHSDEPCSSHSRSDHEMLLLSFVPYIRDMNETELMDLQMEVLTTINKIKRQRVSTQNSFQPQLVAIPLSSPALTHSDSYQSSLQSLEYQSAPHPPLNQSIGISIAPSSFFKSGKNNRHFWIEFIEIYRFLPCLWNAKDDHYNNREFRNAAWLRLLEKLKEEEPSADIVILKKKINTLRSNFNREVRKIRDCAGDRDVYRPTLWYFDNLTFLLDQEKNELEVSFLETVNNQQSAQSDELLEQEVKPKLEIFLNDVHMDTNPDELLNFTPLENDDNRENKQLADDLRIPLKVNSKKSLKQHKKRCFTRLVRQNTSIIYKSPPSDEADIYARAWAVGYRKMRPEQKIYAKRAIEQILTLGQLDALKLCSINEDLFRDAVECNT